MKKDEVSITERVAYVKGLAEGLDLKSQSKEGRILFAILDILQDIGAMAEENTMLLRAVTNVVDDMKIDIGELQDAIGLDPDEGYDYDDEDLIELECPECGETIILPEGKLMLPNSLKCQKCGKRLLPSEN